MHVGGDALALFQRGRPLQLLVQAGIDQGDSRAVDKAFDQLQFLEAPVPDHPPLYQKQRTHRCVLTPNGDAQEGPGIEPFAQNRRNPGIGP